MALENYLQSREPAISYAWKHVWLAPGGLNFHSDCHEKRNKWEKTLILNWTAPDQFDQPS